MSSCVAELIQIFVSTLQWLLNGIRYGQLSIGTSVVADEKTGAVAHHGSEFFSRSGLILVRRQKHRVRLE